MPDYGQLAYDKVNQYLSEPYFGSFGGIITYKSTADAVYNPDDGLVDPGTSVDTDLYGIFLTLNRQGGDFQIDDVNVLTIDRKFLFAAAQIETIPKVGDLIEWDADTWRVMGINQDPKPAHYSLHVRPIS